MTPTAQWTVTGSGCSVLSKDGGRIIVESATIGKVIDFGVEDANNMGAAMAPAAAKTVAQHLSDTGRNADYYDCIATGDLGIYGSELFLKLLESDGIDASSVHKDCGAMIFDRRQQDTHCGGSGCGCGASVLCGHFLPMLERGEAHSILFAATGALMSPMSLQQGESIPSVAHLVHLRKD